MRYKQFNIHNFKGARDILIDLEDSPKMSVHVLVGLNESGKTTILEALHWLHEPAEYRPSSELIPKSELMQFNGEIFVEAVLILSSEDERAIEKKLSKFGNQFKLAEPVGEIRLRRSYTFENSKKTIKDLYQYNFEFRGKTNRMREDQVFTRGDEKWETASAYIEEVLRPEIIYYPNFLFDFPDQIYLEASQPDEPGADDSPSPSATQGQPQPVAVTPPAPRPLDLKERMYSDVIQDILSSFGIGLSVEDHLLKRYKEGGAQLNALESTLRKASSATTNKVFSVWRELLKLEETRGLEITLGQSLKKDGRGIYLEVKILEGDDIFLVRERSLGFMWFFAFILFTHFRSYRSLHQKRTLFLLDEPASNLHPTAQTKLLGVFENFPKEADVIYATHSHHMIDPKWLNGTFVIVNEAKDYSEIDVGYHSRLSRINAHPYFDFVSHHPNDTDFYRPILDALDYQVSKLEFVPEMVIVEGKYDFYTLKYFNEVASISSQVGKHIYPSTGKDKTEYIVALYLGWGREFIVLLDDDKGGKDTRDRLVKEFGPIVEGRVITLREIDKDKFRGEAMEGVFTKPDQMKVIRSLYPDSKVYDKNKLNSAVLSAYVNKIDLDLSEHTINRFRTIFEFLEKRFGELSAT